MFKRLLLAALLISVAAPGMAKAEEAANPATAMTTKKAKAKAKKAKAAKHKEETK